ncbi:MAG: hypothetical protein FJX72_10780 [Armatimonadetes bacterium]|nr:hypothetical protein [Armatimonadota bacterium]
MQLTVAQSVPRPDALKIVVALAPPVGKYGGAARTRFEVRRGTSGVPLSATQHRYIGMTSVGWRQREATGGGAGRRDR